MKSIKEIESEIEFQQQEYDRIKKIIDHKSTTELKKQDYLAIMGRHSARRQALLWVIGT